MARPLRIEYAGAVYHVTIRGNQRRDILRRYVWSSYRSYIGKVKSWSFVHYSPVLAMMGRIKRKQPSIYRRFVETGVQENIKHVITKQH